MWSTILKEDLEINFAYQSFKWKNNAKDNAGVTVVIVGIRNTCSENKYTFDNQIKIDRKKYKLLLI